MSDVKELTDNIKLYKQLKDDAAERVKKAVEQAAADRAAQKARPDRQY